MPFWLFGLALWMAAEGEMGMAFVELFTGGLAAQVIAYLERPEEEKADV